MCGTVWPKDNRGREKTVLVRNWSDDDGLQMDYGEEQSQEDAEEVERSRGTNGEKVLKRLRQSREGIREGTRTGLRDQTGGNTSFPSILVLHAWGEPHELGAKSMCAGGKPT